MTKKNNNNKNNNKNKNKNKKRKNNDNNNKIPPKKIKIVKINNINNLFNSMRNKPLDNNLIDDVSSSDSSDENDETKEYVEIRKKVNTLQDLIELGKLYDKNKRYNISMKKLHNLIEPLEELEKMIGMQGVKKNIINHLLFYLQDLEKGMNDMLHTVVQGPPGVGKTELGKILAKIYLKMGVLKNDTFKIVKRSDLIAKYLGQTAIKTQNVIDSCKGGVMFIDEAYSLGNAEGRDSFSKECIDTINQNLTEGKSNFLCIIAGYKDSLQKCFFNMNKGLDRRFAIRYTIEGYNGNDLFLIFKKILKSNDWKICEKVNNNFFVKNEKYFKFYGGDMETLFFNCKVVHAKRIFGLPKIHHKIIISDDIKSAFKIFKKNRVVIEEDDSWKDLYI